MMRTAQTQVKRTVHIQSTRCRLIVSALLSIVIQIQPSDEITQYGYMTFTNLGFFNFMTLLNLVFFSVFHSQRGGAVEEGSEHRGALALCQFGLLVSFRSVWVFGCLFVSLLWLTPALSLPSSLPLTPPLPPSLSLSLTPPPSLPLSLPHSLPFSQACAWQSVRH